jgi:hypothetical protein
MIGLVQIGFVLRRFLYIVFPVFHITRSLHIVFGLFFADCNFLLPEPSTILYIACTGEWHCLDLECYLVYMKPYFMFLKVRISRGIRGIRLDLAHALWWALCGTVYFW